MAEHHRQHRPHRLSVPQRSFVAPTNSFPSPYPTTPTPTPSKHRHVLPNSNKSSLSFLFLLLFSLRSLYSLLPFLRSSPAFSLFPFSFLVSLMSFLLTFSFSFIRKHRNVPLLSLSSLSPFQLKYLLLKSVALAIVFLLRFQALRYCGTSAMIFAEISGNIAFRFWKDHDRDRVGHSKVYGFILLFVGLFLLSVSWDRIDCFPLSRSNFGKHGYSLLVVSGNCLRIGPMLLPFLSGFLSCYERELINWGGIRQLGRKRVQLISLLFTTGILLFPALVNMLVSEAEGETVSIMNLGWLLANTVLFGVLLNEWYSDEKWVTPRDSEKEFLITFLCTVVLELLYFPELSLWGLLLCGILIWVAIRQLNQTYSNYVELGAESSETFSVMVMRPIRQILSERKSRKIALFLLINTGYMVVEFVAGFMSNSLGLISDACHMLFDCAALAIGLYASYIARLPANNQFNFGRGRFEVLSGYVNAVFLVLVGALIVLESLERILDPQEISTNSLLVVSIGGLLVNVVGLIFFHEEHHHAHGGSCSHSHSQTHSDSQCSHDHDHDHATHIENHDNSCSHSHTHSHSQPSSHHDHEGSTQVKSGDVSLVSVDSCHTHSGSNSSHNEHQKGHDHDHHHHGHNQGHHEQAHTNVHHHDSDSHHDHHHHHHHSHNHEHQDQAQTVLYHDHSDSHHDHHHEGDHHHLHEVDHSHQHDGENIACMTINDSCGEHSGRHIHGSESKNEPSSNNKHHHHHIDHNMEGIFLHVLADTLGSVGVVISTLLIKYKGWLVADPACSMFISVMIVSSVIPLLRNSAEILLHRIPRAHEQDLKAAIEKVVKMKGVCGIQNLHIWSLTNTDVIGTSHLHISSDADKVAVKDRVSRIFEDAEVKDLTLQVECVKSL